MDAPLAEGASVALTRDQAHYLGAVMRRGVGDDLLVFNGADGEWLADIAAINKRQGVLVAREQTREQSAPPDVWLMFAPIKKQRTDFIVEKAAEMGVKYCFIRAGSGKTKQDNNYDHHYIEAGRAGMLRGIYYYMYPEAAATAAARGGSGERYNQCGDFPWCRHR